ncbi:beta-ketoacyl synthase N-terminal-like domain-containing protein [Roseibium sediminis]|uniref:thiolase family protein n=1 Tax=Roseibium sediminis TaxID=1775174 RepID=UPI00123D3DAA|nr:beta-ketoacyl synthase N-terminal-like domain-containing protein [Roseibium sediminis]
MTSSQQAVICAARRTAVAPRGGALSRFQADELAAPVFTSVLEDAGVSSEAVDTVVMGNALYGGGNPARLAALRAGLPVSVPAMTIDTQCCSGLDAIIHAARLVESGAAQCVLAGGMESFSRSPVRMHRPDVKGQEPIAYTRPPFAPPPYADPDLAEAAAMLAAERGFDLEQQAAFAVTSHEKALDQANLEILRREIVPMNEGTVFRDEFTRTLNMRTALRAPVVAGEKPYAVNAATTAVEADAAAAVLVTSRDFAIAHKNTHVLALEAALSVGGETGSPAIAPIRAARRLIQSHPDMKLGLTNVEVMEAYASQALATVHDLDLDLKIVNARGGALSRGHPIGASGTILVVRLFADLVREPTAKRTDRAGLKRRGLALIAAAGGLGTAAVFAPVNLA